MKNIITETENYAVVKVAGGNEGRDGWDNALKGQLEGMEELRSRGLNPLHYLPRFSAWVCEKKQRVTRRREESRPTL